MSWLLNNPEKEYIEAVKTDVMRTWRKFGLEIRDEATLLVSRLRFRYAVNGLTRPLEGDLIYIPMTTSFFEITSVESENDQAMFYTLGRGRGGNVYVYALKMKQFYFSSEIIETGVTEIDSNIRNYYPKLRISLGAGSGKFLNDEIVYQGSNLSSATAQALVYDFQPNAYIDVYRMQGDFTASANVKGNTSSAQWTVTLASDAPVQNTAFEDIIDNARIEAASDNIIDLGAPFFFMNATSLAIIFLDSAILHHPSFSFTALSATICAFRS